MTQRIANRYAPEPPITDAPAPGGALVVRDVLSGAVVALRVVAAWDSAPDEGAVRLRSSALARLRHPHLRAHLDAGYLPDGSLFVVEAPLRGRPVAEVLPLPPDQVPGVFLGLLQALRALHRRGFAHGALGIAHVSLGPDFAPMLALGPRLGLGARPDDDLAALGSLFFHLLTGREPALGETLPSQAASNVPGHQDALVHRLLTGGCETLDDVFSLLPPLPDEGVPLPLSAGPLVGRDEALATLSGALSAAIASRQGQLVAVTGAAGVGKSRLLETAALGWRLGGTPVLMGRASADGAPYRPWIELLAQALPLARTRCPEVLAAAAPALAALSDAVGAPAAPALEPRQEMLRLQGALADVIGAIAQGGLALVLEDWHLADPLSRETLAFVARLSGDRPLVIALAGTAAEAGPTPDLTLPLGPLDTPELASLATDLLGGRPLAAPALEAVASATGGNPRLVMELLGNMAAAGQLRPGPGGWALVGALGEGSGDLAQLQVARLRALEPETLEAARLAAVVGADGDMALLKTLWPHAADALALALERSCAEGLLQTSGASFRFESPAWPRHLEALTEPETWRADHDRAAASLSATHSAAPDAILRRANHALAGSVAGVAIAAAIAAAQCQIAFNDPVAARRYLDGGLGWWERDGGASGPHAAFELDYRRLLGDVSRMGGEYGLAVGHYQRACELAEIQGERALHAYMLTSTGKCLQMSNKYPEAEGFYRSSLEAYEALNDPAGQLRALTSLARVHMIVGQRQKAESLYMRALVEAEATGQTLALATALGALGLNLVSNDPSRIQEGIGYLERAVSLSQSLGDKIGLNEAYSLLGNAYVTLGLFPQAREAFRRNQRLCFECGLTDDEIFALINLSIVALEMGEFARGRSLARAAEERAIKSRSRFCESLAIALAALAGAYLADLVGVSAALESAVAISRDLKNKYLEINVLVWQAESELIFGRLTEAVEVAQAATALMEELGYREFEPRLLVIRAEVHARLAEREEAHALLGRAHQLATENQNVGMTARVLKTMAWLSLQEKNLLQARDQARSALEAAEGVEAVYLAGEAHWLLGEVELAAGQHPQATRELLKALAAGEGTESPHLQCLALFCLARAADDDLRTREYLFQARDLLRAQLAQLDEWDREDYLALAERWRVDRGELLFAEKARAQQGQAELGPEGRLYFERLQTFSHFTAALHGLALGEALETLLELFEAERVCLLVAAPDGRRLIHHVRGGEAPRDAGADQAVLEALWGGTEVFYQPYVSEDARFAGLYAGQSASLLAAPFGRGVAMAVREGATFTPPELALMAMVGAQFRVATETADRLGARL